MRISDWSSDVCSSGLRVGLLTLDRPKALNALSNEVIDELSEALRAFDADENIGAIVLTGSEKAFAAGADISAMQGWSYMDVYKQDYLGGNWESVKRIRKTIITDVAGYERNTVVTGKSV